MPWKPSAPGEVPTLGYLAIDWIAEMLAAPDRADYEPFILYPEQEDFVLEFYELHPVTGKRLKRRGVISRPRGWGKSPFLAALALCEAFGPVVPDGWDADGQPVGRPWSSLRTTLVQIIAVSERQTKNTWRPLLEMCEGPIADAYRVEPLDTFVTGPRVKIEPITSAARTVKGNPADFAVLDQTEEWVKSNGGLNLFEKIKNNTAKRGGSFVESPNAFVPGDDSVAEASASFWQAIQEGRAKDEGLHYDHREAPAETDLEDRASLTLGLRIAYGDASAHPDGCLTPGHEDNPCPPGHVDLDPLIATIWDPTSDVQVSRADFLNQVTHASDSFLSQPEWAAIRASDKILRKGEAITLGFDGSRGRAKGKPDATALLGCRVSDGHLFEIGRNSIWEADDAKSTWAGWEPPIVEIEAAIAHAFANFKVVGFYADPAKDWRSHVNTWEAKYGGRVIVKNSSAHPFEWWMTGGRSTLVQRAIEGFEGAVQNQDLTHSGSQAVTRHILNTRKRLSGGKLALAKENDYSSKKIDAAVAAVLAYQARLDAIAAGALKKPKKRVPVRRLR